MSSPKVDAMTASGDTARLAQMAGAIEAAGRLSAYGRDSRLHHQMEGLLAAAWMPPIFHVTHIETVALPAEVCTRPGVRDSTLAHANHPVHAWQRAALEKRGRPQRVKEIVKSSPGT
jgi:hypothetical protein